MTDNLNPKLEQIAVNTITNGIQIITISNIIYPEIRPKKNNYTFKKF